jgi:hypothetical protein
MSLKYMNRSSTRGISLSVALLFSLVLIAFPSNVYGEGISVTSVALEETSLLELTNDSTKDVNTLRIWLGNDFNFKSFKTEKGWVGEKNSQGVIVFTSSQSIKPGESIKFGVKTDKVNSGINWKALDNKDIQVATGMSIAKEIPLVVENSDIDQSLENTGESMTTESIFRIVPEKPNIGSTIRVTGDNFGLSQEFDFYIDTKKIGTFETDKNGHFITTMKIPDNQKADRAEFIVKDKKGEERKISLRIGENNDRIADSLNIPLTIKGISDIVHRGDFLEIFGTGQPNSAITAEIKTSDGEVINSRTAEIDSKGDWKLDEPIIIPLDTTFGKYSATITDGRDSKLISWTIESDKKIIIIPTSLKFEQGEIMKFNGTAIPNSPIEVTLEDPLGKEIISDIIQVDESGIVEFEFTTTQNSIEGTYTLIATQDKDKEFIYAGVGQLPSIPVNLEFDKLNYKESETAIITLSGKASEIISLLIIDPSDKPKGDAVSITLQPDGRGSYSIDLDGFASGVYTAVISKGSVQNTEIFTLGLQVGSGEIKINTTKEDYHPGDSILVLGDTGSNVLLTLTLIDPNGSKIKIKETFSDKDGRITEGSFRIPSDAISGLWTINAKSGSNFDNDEIEVIGSMEGGMLVSAVEIIDPETAYLGKQIMFEVTGARQTVTIEVIAEDGEIIGELSFTASAQGEISLPWLVPQDTEPGIYTIKASDAFDSAETTFELK